MSIQSINAETIHPRFSEDVIIRNSTTEMKRQVNGEEQSQEKQKPQNIIQISENFMNDLNKNMEAIHNLELQFSMNNDTGKVVVKVIDRETGKLIRQIPPQELLDLASKLQDIGILFDRKM